MLQHIPSQRRLESSQSESEELEDFRFESDDDRDPDWTLMSDHGSNTQISDSDSEFQQTRKESLLFSKVN